MIRRKTAFWIAAVATLLLCVFRIEEIPGLADVAFFGMDMTLLCGLFFIVISLAVAILFFSRQTTPVQPAGKWNTPCGWIATFTGPVMTMAAVVDIFSFDSLLLGNAEPTSLDYTLVIGELLFEILGGVYLAAVGFRWISGQAPNSTAMKWMSVCPAVWMWIRLARYEISYASTIDIKESFFDFAVLVFASLFFLQFGRSMANIGKQPKNSLAILAICLAMVSISGIPATITHLSISNNTYGLTLHDLMTVFVDCVIGLTALVFAAMKTFHTPPVEESVPSEAEEESAATAWVEPQKEYAPLDPPFSPDNLLPHLDDNEPIADTPVDEEVETEADNAPQPSVEESSVPPVVKKSEAPVSIDDLLSEIDTIQ